MSSHRHKPVIFLAFANDRNDSTRYLRNLPEELRNIRRRLNPVEEEGLCEVVVRPNITVNELLDVFQDKRYRNRIAIFHFGGHAGGYQLLVESATGSPVMAHADGLADFLGQQNGLQLVFLNGCSTQPQVEGLLEASIPAVIATSETIEDEIATAFSSRFYAGLAGGGSVQTAYHDAVAAVKTKGGYDDTKWRFFEASTMVEYSDTMTIKPGEAYWIVTKDGGKLVDTGAGATLPTDKPYERDINPGWNFFGNPFNFPIFVNQLSLKSSKQLYVFTYTGNSWISVDSPGTIEPMEGYIVWNDDSSLDALVINSDVATVLGSTPKRSERGKRKAESWTVNIRASAGDAHDLDNRAGILPDAIDGWDRFDKPEPPRVWEYVSVYFVDEDGQSSRSKGYDIRAASTMDRTWHVKVVTNAREPVELTFDGITEVPERYEVWLVDDILNHTQNLREDPVYMIIGGTPEVPRPLSLMVGTAAELQDRLAESEQLPREYALYPNFPNPFNPSTTIKYALPEAAHVSMIVYNMLGQQVAALEANVQRKAGYHSVIWDGRSSAGTPVASGAYFVRLQAGSFAKTRKMILVK